MQSTHWEGRRGAGGGPPPREVWRGCCRAGWAYGLPGGAGWGGQGAWAKPLPQPPLSRVMVRTAWRLQPCFLSLKWHGRG